MALKRVDEIMIEGHGLPVIGSKESMMAAFNVLFSKGHGIVGMLKEGVLVGVVTNSDIGRHLLRNPEFTMQTAFHETSVEVMMTEGSIVVAPKMVVGDALLENASLLTRRHLAFSQACEPIWV